MRLTLIIAACLGTLALASGASAGTPRLALFDLRTDLAGASHNTYGDVKVWTNKAGLAARTHGATLVRCAGDCTYGAGWLAFKRGPELAAGDVASAKTEHSRKAGWSLVLTLTPRGTTRFQAFKHSADPRARRLGVADALVVVLDGSIVAQPLESQLRLGKKAPTLAIPGFRRSQALAAAKLFG